MAPRQKQQTMEIDDNDNDDTMALDTTITTSSNNSHDDTAKRTPPTKLKDTAMKSGRSSSSCSSSTTNSIVSCIMYSTCSVSMVLANKSIATSTPSHMDISIVIVIFQAVFTVICVEVCKHLRLIDDYPSIYNDTFRQLPQILRYYTPISVFFCGMLLTGMISLKFNSVLMVTIFKNVTNIVIALGDYVWFDTKITGLIAVSFLLTLSGAILTALYNANNTSATTRMFSPMGLVWLFANCGSTAGYVLYMKYSTSSTTTKTTMTTPKLSKFGMMYYNNLLCIVFLLPAAYIMGQWTTAMEFLQDESMSHGSFLTKNMISGAIGFGLNFASLYCVQSTSPTTFAVVGSLNKIPVAILGYFLFDNTISKQTCLFIAISLCGGFLYSHAKIIQSKHQQQEQEQQQEPSEKQKQS